MDTERGSLLRMCEEYKSLKLRAGSKNDAGEGRDPSRRWKREEQVFLLGLRALLALRATRPHSTRPSGHGNPPMRASGKDSSTERRDVKPPGSSGPTSALAGLER